MTCVKGQGRTRLIIERNSPQSMSALRQRLPRFAALVLLVWLFATGVAFAHACQSRIDLDCDQCCPEMKATAAFTEEAAVTVAAAQPDLLPPPPSAALQPAWSPAERRAPAWHHPPDPGGSQPIPIFFLRLAL